MIGISFVFVFLFFWIYIYVLIKPLKMDGILRPEVDENEVFFHGWTCLIISLILTDFAGLYLPVFALNKTALSSNNFLVLVLSNWAPFMLQSFIYAISFSTLLQKSNVLLHPAPFLLTVLNFLIRHILSIVITTLIILGVFSFIVVITCSTKI